MNENEQLLADARAFILKYGEGIPAMPREGEDALHCLVALAIVHGERRGHEACAKIAADAFDRLRETVTT